MFVSAIHQQESAISIPMAPPESPLDLPSLSAVTEHQALFPVFYGNFPLAICFTHGSVYISMLLSQFVPPSFSPTVPISLFSMSESLFLPCK